MCKSVAGEERAKQVSEHEDKYTKNNSDGKNFFKKTHSQNRKGVLHTVERKWVLGCC